MSACSSDNLSGSLDHGPLHPAWPSDSEIAQAAGWLDAGELVAFPTETVYGLGGDACNPRAVTQIYTAKGRPATHPVIVHLAPDSDPAYWVRTLPSDARKLIDAFWPGPLTLILKRAAHIPAAVSGGQDSIGLRCPSHPVAQALLRAFSALRQGHGGVAAPSANKFGHVSPTSAQHVRDEFADTVHVLDGGVCDVGIESTILDLSRGFPALLRPGRVTPAEIAQVLGAPPHLPEGSDVSVPRASGTLKAHYAPHTPLVWLPHEALMRAVAARAPQERIAVIAHQADAQALRTMPNVVFVAAPDDPHRYARALYRLLRELDQMHVQCIFVEQLPQTVQWAAVNDRLGRAAAAFMAGDE